MTCSSAIVPYLYLGFYEGESQTTEPCGHRLQACPIPASSQTSDVSFHLYKSDQSYWSIMYYYSTGRCARYPQGVSIAIHQLISAQKLIWSRFWLQRLNLYCSGFYDIGYVPNYNIPQLS